jgi:hypothetical protein
LETLAGDGGSDGRHQHLRVYAPLTSRFLRANVGNLEQSRERGVQMSMPSPIGRNWPDAMRPLEMRRRAQDVANFAEYLAEDAGGDPDRTLDAMGALAEWCEGDHELLTHARNEVVRHRRRGQLDTVRINHQALELLALVDSASQTK